jgi:hypothetical protein
MHPHFLQYIYIYEGYCGEMEKVNVGSLQNQSYYSTEYFIYICYGSVSN